MALPKGGYNHKDHEEIILRKWLEQKMYKPEYYPLTNTLQTEAEETNDKRPRWCLICPPPNAYGRPHVGNISGYAYMDAMARFQRMNGKKVLMLPGKDHAGLEGEGVYVREVLEKQGKNKFDMNRDDFYNDMMEWMKNNMEQALKDEQTIGLSADFDRNTFTLDPDIVEIVLDTFVEMYNAGMIYKGVRIVNWDPKARTAVADNQVEYKETQSNFYYFKYAFGEPVSKALSWKENFHNKIVNFKVTKKNSKFPYLQGVLPTGEKVIACGYQNEKETPNQGRVVGVRLGFDENYALVVVPVDLSDKNKIEEVLSKINFFESQKYPGGHVVMFDLEGDDAFKNGFIIGTVRPETIFADTAIACNPKDERYKKFMGKKVKVSFLGKVKEISFIADYAVDKDFGTGLLKITPAHSQVDWEIAQRHPEQCLPAIQVIGYDLRLNHLTGEYAGLTIKEARERLELDMQKHGNLVAVDKAYQNKIQIAERTKAPIEPLLSSQWYLKYDYIKEEAIKMVKEGRVKIHPKSMKKKFYHWMYNLRDWAISRSLWWGYRLPVWYHGKVKEIIDDSGQVKEMIEIKPGEWVELEYDNPEHLRVQKECPGPGWVQDDNVLDTWFSSGQWPFATLMKYKLMDQYYPTDVMVSGYDILENWISRMMMFSAFKCAQEPFKDVYLTGLVKGTDGQKMSKSRGNLIDIDKVREDYGTDALRMAYFYQNSAGASYALTYDKLKMFKHFANKIWNASKFVLMNIEDLDKNEINQMQTEDFKLNETKELVKQVKFLKKKITKNILEFQFGHATDSLYSEFWHDFCDIRIETLKKFIYPKKDENGNVIEDVNLSHKKEASLALIYALREYLKMLHPFMPFITERIWQEIPKIEGDHDSLLYSKW
ncbi:MAG: hypothetical protein KatS3mg085_114 [Candidatus Dojkabacteria bacterium]|nr:MAG: hypothetical protein KatS3mg085_114 [Candidatus Dojkabacteria bacterium]